MQFTIDDVSYSAEDLNDAGKHSLSQLAAIAQERSQLQLRLEHLAIIEAAYTEALKANLPAAEEV